MLVPVFAEVLRQTGWTKRDIGFWCSGSSDYLAGRAFSFVSALDAIGALPPINESHVEMDAAWALYEAWVKIQTGEVDTALVYGFGKSLGRRSAPHAGAAARPVHGRAAVARLRVARRPAGARSASTPGCGTSRTMAEVAARSLARRRRATRTRSSPGRSTSTSCSPSRCTPTRCASTTARRSPTAPRRSCSPPTTGRASCAERPAWITRHRPPHRPDAASAPAT